MAIKGCRSKSLDDRTFRQGAGILNKNPLILKLMRMFSINKSSKIIRMTLRTLLAR